MRVFVSLLLCFLLIVPASAVDAYEVGFDTELYSDSGIEPYVVEPGNPEYTFIDGVLKYAPFGGTPSTLVSMTVPQLLNFYGIATLDDVEARATTVPMMVNALQTYFGNPANKAPSSTTAYPLWYDAVQTGILGADGSREGFGVPNSSYSLAQIVANGFSGLATLSRGLSGRARLMPGGDIQISDKDYGVGVILQDGLTGIGSLFNSSFYAYSGLEILTSDGSVISLADKYPLGNITAHGFAGLGTILNRVDNHLFGTDYVTTFSMLSPDLRSTQNVQANNLLDALGIMGTQLQNPLQKLAFVFANDQDLEIREDVSENLDAAQDNFFKPGSNGSVSAGDIKDVASVTSGFKSSLSSPVSVSDFLTQFNSDSNLGYYSESTRADLDTVSSPMVISDDSFFDDVFALDVDDDGFVSFYDPDALLNFLGKEG